MKVFKALNLYACLGGNRFKWDEVAEEAGIDLKVTAVEIDPELARLYQERFPNDIVIVADAHQYLLDHYKEFDFIWSSPPCPLNSRARFWGLGNGVVKPCYPDLRLYEEYIFLKHHFEGRFTVENVIPYYEPLIPGSKRDRHIYWANFPLPNNLSKRERLFASLKDDIKKLCEFHEIDLSTYKGDQRKTKIARNLVDYEAGRTIFETALGIIKKSNEKQMSIFD